MTINAKLYQSSYLWFRQKDETLSQIIGDHTEANEVKFRTNFDYEKLTATKLRIYLDICLETAQAEILYRCGYEFRLKHPQWDEVFVTDVIHPLVSVAIDNSCKCFNALCTEYDISAPTLKFDDQITAGITSTIIDQYTTYRRNEDIANDFLMNNTGITYTSGSKTINLLQGTFIILDAFLYQFPAFDYVHNLKEFEKIMPFTKYLTLKLNCWEIEKKTVKLSFLNMIFLVQCVDCALKLLLGDKADKLIPLVEKSGMDEEMRGMYITEGAKFVQGIYASLNNSGARVMNLEVLHDWDALFR